MESSEVVQKPEGDDVLVRLILHPREIAKDTGQFDEGRFFLPTKLDKKSKRSPVVWSVGLKKALPTEHDVHLYGCRTAKISREERHKDALTKDENAVISREPNYLGYYEFIRSKILAVTYQDTKVTIEQKTEHGEKAHCNITMSPTDALVTADWSEARLRFISAMAVLLSGPRKHICEDDEDLREDLEKVDLPRLPLAGKEAA